MALFVLKGAILFGGHFLDVPLYSTGRKSADERPSLDVSAMLKTGVFASGIGYPRPEGSLLHLENGQWENGQYGRDTSDFSKIPENYRAFPRRKPTRIIAHPYRLLMGGN